ncbi:hypothetical protein GXP67_29825 [Rhodocytophaga rosea]|uniref:Glycosyltransferase RgtA/B/C/D-like domain-containing protein n=1 Tax=Rhodocytophaga rosea TaxID=2704465 RepID=A0A6C0GSG2_9BACT|nr:hypothetical protein [Rhodocytophaga rosea]QHT70553.1 hypothetical protein GXP67_29825 [Rhodocytophaga rosea]
MIFFLYQHYLYYGHQFWTQEGLRLYVEAFDTISYLIPVENLLYTGQYIQIPEAPFSQVTRMPGYGLFYLLFRLVFDQNTTKNILVLLQVIISGISVYYLARIGYLLSNRKQVFYVVFILYGLSAYVSMYDVYILTESFSTCSIIIATYLLVQHRKKLFLQWRYILISGMLMAISCFMRPAAVPILGIAIIYVSLSTPTFRTKIKLVLVFSLPFLVADAAWIIRNFTVLSRFIPLQYNSWLHKTGYPPYDVEYYSYEWIRDVGEDNVFYQFNTLGAWLYNNTFVEPGYILPAHIYSSAYNKDSLYALREKFLLFWNNRSQLINTPEGIAHARLLNETFHFYSSAYEKEHLFAYLITNRVKLLDTFLFHSGVSQLPLPSFRELVENLSGTLLLKIGWSLLYWIILVAGLMSILTLMLSYSYEKWLIAGIILYSLLIFPFVIRVVELRYICLAYPFLTVGAGIFLERIIVKLNNFVLFQKVVKRYGYKN